MKVQHASFGISVVLVALIGGLVLFAPVVSADGHHAGETLVVATWGGDWQATLHRLVGERIEEMTGAEVVYVTGNPLDHMARLVAARGTGDVPFDVLEMEESVPPQASRAGFLAPLSPERIPNLQLLADEHVEQDRVAFLSMEYGIAYNKERFEELGLEKPTSWMDLFQEELAGRVAVPDMNVSMGPYFLVGLAIEGGGDEENISPAWDLLQQLDVAYYFRSSADLATRFTAGDVWAAVWTNSRAFRLANDGYPIDFARVYVGDHVGMAGNNWVGIVEGTPRQELAELFVNLLLDAETQYERGRWGVVGPVNPEAARLFAADEVLAEQTLWRDEDFAVVYNLDWDSASRRMPDWVDTFTRAIVD